MKQTEFDFDASNTDTCSICGNLLPIDTIINGGDICDSCINDESSLYIDNDPDNEEQ